MKKSLVTQPCPCGAAGPYAQCCGRYIDAGLAAPSAQELMRSRYTAFALEKRDYLLATWHPRTRPAALTFETPAPRWLGLDVRASKAFDADHATVEFVARYKSGGRGFRLHEKSRFVREGGRWFYVDGDTHA